MQTLSGTGALRIAAEFIAKFSDSKPKVYISDPSWGNHHTIFQKAGLETTKYRCPPDPTKPVLAILVPADSPSSVLIHLLGRHHHHFLIHSTLC